MELNLDNEQVDREFNAIVAGQTNSKAAEKLAGLMDLAHEMGGWPDDSAPKLVRHLWK